MKIALAAMPVRNREVSFNLQTMVEAIGECGGKAELVLFGEAVLQGFDCLCWDYETDRQTAIPLTDSPIRLIRETARKNKIAVSFGFIERADDSLYSSQAFIGADGEIVHVFHRVSPGWKDYRRTDSHYREGEGFEAFSYNGKRFAIGLCGDLWTEGRPAEMKRLNADVVLWPVWCDYNAAQWNHSIQYEYAEQADLCGNDVLLVNPFCADSGETQAAAGGAAHFRAGQLAEASPAGKSGILIVEI